MIACNGDDDMGRTCDAGGNHRHERRYSRCILQSTTSSHRKTMDPNASDSCRGYALLPHTGRCKQDTCPDLVSKCNLLDGASSTMSPLQSFLLHLFSEKGIKNPRHDVRLIVDSQSGMIVGHEGKGGPASRRDVVITTPDARKWEAAAYEPNTSSIAPTGSVVGWSEMNGLMESSVEDTVEDSITSFVSVFPVDCSNEQDILGHSSYRSIDMSITIKDEVNPRTNESPTSIVDMLGFDDITKEKENPWCPFLLSGRAPGNG